MRKKKKLQIIYVAMPDIYQMLKLMHRSVHTGRQIALDISRAHANKGKDDFEGTIIKLF